MKIVPLRQLLREPLKIKRWTRAGRTVQVNDKGQPLWVIKSAEETVVGEQVRRREIKEMFGEIDAEPAASVSLSKIIKESRA